MMNVPSPAGAARTAIVIGGGIIGQATAFCLQQRGIATRLIDPEIAGRGASWGNAGHIAIEQAEPLASRATLRDFPKRLFVRGGALSLPLRAIGHWLPFAVRLAAASHPQRFASGRVALGAMLERAMPAWRQLLRAVDRPDLLREDGHFVVWESPATAAAGHARWRAADIGTAAIRAVTSDERRQLQALTTIPLAGAIRFSGSGHIVDLEALANALAKGFAQAGGIRIQAKVARLDIEAGQARVKLADGATAEAEAIIVAGGAGSAALLRPLGHKVPLIAERGYHIQSAATDWPLAMPPVVFEDRSMIVTRFQAGLRAASFVEFGGAATRPDRRKWERLRRHVRRLGLSFGGPGAEWVGARPTLPDYLPAIGRSNRAANLFYAFGHQHLGLTLAAITGEAVAALVAGAPVAFDLAPFDLTRFGAGS